MEFKTEIKKTIILHIFRISIQINVLYAEPSEGETKLIFYCLPTSGSYAHFRLVERAKRAPLKRAKRAPLSERSEHRSPPGPPPPPPGSLRPPRVPTAAGRRAAIQAHRFLQLGGLKIFFGKTSGRVKVRSSWRVVKSVSRFCRMFRRKKSIGKNKTLSWSRFKVKHTCASSYISTL